MRWTATVAAVLASASAWTIQNGAVSVSGRGDSPDRVPFADVGRVDLPKGRSLDVAFEILPVGSQPHQAALLLKSESGAEKLFVAKVRGKLAKVVLPHKLVPDSLRDTVLKASVLAASFDGEPALVSAFDLFVEPERPSGPGSDAAAPKGSVKYLLHKLPEIRHTFPTPPRTVSAVVALVFIGAALFSMALLLITWGAVTGFKLGGFGFVLAIGGVEAVFLAYFVQLSIFSTLFYTALLAPVVFLTGQRVLKADKGIQTEPATPVAKPEKVEKAAKK